MNLLSNTVITVYGKTSTWENFRGFRGFSAFRESFPVNVFAVAMHIVSRGQTFSSAQGVITFSAEERSGHVRLQCIHITQHYLANREAN